MIISNLFTHYGKIEAKVESHESSFWLRIYVNNTDCLLIFGSDYLPMWKLQQIADTINKEPRQ